MLHRGLPHWLGSFKSGGFWLGAAVMAVAFFDAFTRGEFATPALVIVAVGLAAAFVMTIVSTSRPLGQGMLLGLLTTFGLVFFVAMAANW